MNINLNVFQGHFCVSMLIQPPPLLLVHERGEEATSSNQALRVPFCTVDHVQDQLVLALKPGANYRLPSGYKDISNIQRFSFLNKEFQFLSSDSYILLKK